MMMVTVEVTMMLGYLCGIAKPANNLFCPVDLFYHTDRDIGSLKGWCKKVTFKATFIPFTTLLVARL